jgi:hypothetical protein
MKKSADTKKAKFKKAKEVATGPSPEEDASKLDLTQTMAKMTDFELVQVGLVAMALLHQRAVDIQDDGPKENKV